MKREIYHKLLAWKTSKKRKPLLLKGARQVGKTWLIEEFGREEFSQVHTFNFQEDPELHSVFQASLNPMKILETLELSYSVTISLDQDLIFFDEIQECPQAVTSLKFFCEKLPQAAVCCAGSHIGATRLETSFPVGKIDSLLLYPLSFQEFISNHHPEMLELLSHVMPLPKILHNRLVDILTTYFVVGGLPEANLIYQQSRMLTPDIFSEIRYVQDQIITGYMSDFAKHSGKVNANHIVRVFENIPRQIMKADDYSVGRYRFKDVLPGYSKFMQLIGPIDWLIQAGLSYPVFIIDHPAIPLKSNKKENFFKLMLFDIGLLNCMNDLSLSTLKKQGFGSYKGYLAENFVAQELMAYGQRSLYSWTGRTSEVEFLLQQDDTVTPLEVKSGKRLSRTKSLDVYIQKYNPQQAYTVSLRNYEQHGIKTNIPLYALASFL